MQIPREENKSHVTTYILKYPRGGHYFIIPWETTVQAYVRVIAKYSSKRFFFISLVFVKREMMEKISKL